MRNASESMPRMGRRTGWWVLAFAVLLSGCGVNPQKVTVPVVPAVDLQRFMGPWYVITTQFFEDWKIHFSVGFFHATCFFPSHSFVHQKIFKRFIQWNRCTTGFGCVLNS